MKERIIYEGKHKRHHIQSVCKYCGKTFWHDKRSKSQYCNLKCKGLDSRIPRTIFECSHCGKEIIRSEKDIKHSKSGLFFCNKTCKAKEQKVFGKLDVYGKNNARVIAFRSYENKCAICGYDENTTCMDVHHIDSNHNNNNKNNLIILCVMCHAKITRGIAKLSKDKKYLEAVV